MNTSQRQPFSAVFTIVFIIVLGGFGVGPVAIAVDCPTPNFAAGGTFGAGSQPVAVTVSDLNGDGYADLVWVGQISANVFVQMGNGNGTFQSASNYACGSGPSS